MGSVSITSTESFATRAKRSEALRVALWITVLVGMFVITLTRRLMSGMVMSKDRLYFPYQGVLALAIVCQSVLLLTLRRESGWISFAIMVVAGIVRI